VSAAANGAAAIAATAAAAMIIGVNFSVFDMFPVLRSSEPMSSQLTPINECNLLVFVGHGQHPDNPAAATRVCCAGASR
jgi:hypothetical protein